MGRLLRASEGHTEAGASCACCHLVRPLQNVTLNIELFLKLNIYEKCCTTFGLVILLLGKSRKKKKKEPVCGEEAIPGNLAVANKLGTTKNAQKQYS